MFDDQDYTMDPGWVEGNGGRAHLAKSSSLPSSKSPAESSQALRECEYAIILLN